MKKQITKATNIPNPNSRTIDMIITCVTILAGLYIITNSGYGLEINTKDSTLKLVRSLPQNSHPIAA